MPGTNWKIDLAWLAKQAGIRARTVCECGVGPLDISIAPSFVRSDNYKKLLLIEPIKWQAERVRRELGVEVLEVAIDDKPGEISMVDNGGSSYIRGNWAPTPVDPTVQTLVTVPAVTFDTLDDGEIDIMNLDCEGKEFAVLQNMRSRPLLFVVEVWSGNPFATQIMQWFGQNDYKLRFSTGPTSETHLFSLCM